MLHGGVAWTRPILLLDEKARRMCCFGTHPARDGRDQLKFSSLDAPAFATGVGMVGIQSALDPTLERPDLDQAEHLARDGPRSSSASQAGSSRYWHNFSSLGGPVPALPSALFGSEPAHGLRAARRAVLRRLERRRRELVLGFRDGGSSNQRNPTHACRCWDLRGRADRLQRARLEHAHGTAVDHGAAHAGDADAHGPRGRAGAPGVARLRNYGALPGCAARKDVSSDYHAFVKFYLPDTGKQIATARLRLWADDGGPDGGTVQAVPTTWSEARSRGATPRAGAPARQPRGRDHRDVGRAGRVEREPRQRHGRVRDPEPELEQHLLLQPRGHAPAGARAHARPADAAGGRVHEATPLHGPRPLTVQFSRSLARRAHDLRVGLPGTAARTRSCATPHAHHERGDYDVELTVTGPNGFDVEVRKAFVHVLKQLASADPPP